MEIWYFHDHNNKLTRFLERKQPCVCQSFVYTVFVGDFTAFDIFLHSFQGHIYLLKIATSEQHAMILFEYVCLYIQMRTSYQALWRLQLLINQWWSIEREKVDVNEHVHGRPIELFCLSDNLIWREQSKKEEKIAWCMFMKLANVGRHMVLIGEGQYAHESS